MAPAAYSSCMALLLAVACVGSGCGDHTRHPVPDLSRLPPQTFRGVSLGLGVEQLSKREFLDLVKDPPKDGIVGVYEGTDTFSVLKRRGRGGGRTPLTVVTRLALFSDGWAIWSSYDSAPGEPVRGGRQRAKWSRHDEGYVLDVERPSGSWDVRIPFSVSGRQIVLRHNSLGGPESLGPDGVRRVKLERLR